MKQAVRRALQATESADDEIMAMAEVERATRRLVKAVLDMRQVRQTKVGVRDRRYEGSLREERR